MAATTEETAPYLKQHNGETICFADTTTQVANALKRTGLEDGANADDLNQAHLMLFGVEDWDATKAKNLAGAFKNANNTFKRLEIFGCDIKEDAQRELAAGFTPANMTHVKQFDLDNTTITVGGANAIFNNIAECAGIEKINLQGSVGTPGVLKAINEQLVDKCNVFTTLSHLDLKINDLKEDAGEPIKALMSKFMVPTHLDLFYNSLKVPGAQAIGQALNEDAKIVHLDLCCNDIGDAGAESIASGLKSNNYIEVLKLALNNIGNKGGMAIMKALAPVDKSSEFNTSLRILDMSANVMKEETDAKPTDEQQKWDDELNKIFEEEAPYQEIALSFSDEVTDEMKDEANKALELILPRKLAAIKAKIEADPRPLRTQLCEVILECRGRLEEFDFTGIEFDSKGWDALGSQLALQTDDVSEEVYKSYIKLKFSIVDLMSKENLNILEPMIWKTEQNPQLYKNYTTIDWRRIPEEAAQPATNN